jgi:hypothetical protein
MHVKSFLCSLLLLFAFSLSAQAPTAVPVGKEPHHHLVFENDYVRVFRVSLAAHDATLLHQHDVPYLYVSLGPADVINAVEGKPEARIVMTDGQVGYSRGHFAHIARTDAGSTFDNVTIELLKPQGEPQNLCEQILSGAAVGPCQKMSVDNKNGYSIVPQLQTGEMKVDLVILGPRARTIGTVPLSGTLLVGLNDSKIRFNLQDGQTKTLHGGEVIWLEASSHESLANQSKNPSKYLQLTFTDSAAKP